MILTSGEKRMLEKLYPSDTKEEEIKHKQDLCDHSGTPEMVAGDYFSWGVFVCPECGKRV